MVKMLCSFCQMYLDDMTDCMSCDNPNCTSVICLDCVDDAFLYTSCCDKTYCRLCNISEYTSCDNCEIDMCSLNCTRYCLFCNRKACLTCTAFTWTCCNKCGKILCCEACYYTKQTNKCIACDLNVLQIK